MNPRFPVFIPTKGRHESRLTIKLFDRLNIPYTVFIEEQEYDQYAKHVDKKRIIILPHRDKGLSVTRNAIWDHAAKLGYEWFWTFDDNITGLYRLTKNQKVPCGDGTPLAVVEDFTLRYKNIAIAGMHYYMFAPRKIKIPPVYFNTRVYSNMLIRTFAKDKSGQPFRNILFFNDDTDLCIRVLKSGWCTVLFNAFLIRKLTTMKVKGGMTNYYKETNNRREFAEELVRAHPDIVKLTKKWGRYQHQVDYRPFKRNKLQLKNDAELKSGINNYGMVLKVNKRAKLSKR